MTKTIIVDLIWKTLQTNDKGVWLLIKKPKLIVFNSNRRSFWCTMLIPVLSYLDKTCFCSLFKPNPLDYSWNKSESVTIYVCFAVKNRHLLN